MGVRHNYGFEKYQRDQAKKKKAEEKRERRQRARGETAIPSQETPSVPGGDSPAAN